MKAARASRWSRRRRWLSEIAATSRRCARVSAVSSRQLATRNQAASVNASDSRQPVAMPAAVSAAATAKWVLFCSLPNRPEIRSPLLPHPVLLLLN